MSRRSDPRDASNKYRKLFTIRDVIIPHQGEETKRGTTDCTDYTKGFLMEKANPCNQCNLW